MRLIKLDSGDVKALDNISKTHPPNRFVYPAFGVRIVLTHNPAAADSVLLGQSRFPRQAVNNVRVLATNLVMM
jgi:hypothetical protein